MQWVSGSTLIRLISREDFTASRHLPGGSREIHEKTVSHDTRCPGRNSSQVTPECKSIVLPLHQPARRGTVSSTEQIPIINFLDIIHCPNFLNVSETGLAPSSGKTPTWLCPIDRDNPVSERTTQALPPKCRFKYKLRGWIISRKPVTVLVSQPSTILK